MERNSRTKTDTQRHRDDRQTDRETDTQPHRDIQTEKETERGTYEGSIGKLDRCRPRGRRFSSSSKAPMCLRREMAFATESLAGGLRAWDKNESILRREEEKREEEKREEDERRKREGREGGGRGRGMRTRKRKEA
jgi:hypothetical protein